MMARAAAVRAAHSCADAPRPGARWPALVLATASLALGGCATFSDSFGVVERSLVARRFDQALIALDSQPHATGDEVLYRLNQGMLRRMAGDVAGSNESLEVAKQLMEKLYGTSISEQAVSFVINDAARAYVGEEHEQVLVHLYKALNYLALGELNSARVEALQVDVRLRELSASIPDGKYNEDAFARYLTGMIYEDLGEWSDALIAYRKAYETYKRQREHFKVEVPVALKLDLLRLTERQGLTDEMRALQKEFGISSWPNARETARDGEVVLILHNGLAPILREQSVAALDVTSGHMVRISLPHYESRALPIGLAVLAAQDTRASGETVENIEAIARASLDSKMAALTARNIARQAIKKKLAREATRAARNNGGRDNDLLSAFIGVGMEVAAFATERADTRSWVTLPREIMLVRLRLPPGRHSVTAELQSSYGQLSANRVYTDIEVRAGRRVYLEQHFPPTEVAQRRR